MGKELKRNEQKNAILDDVMNYLRNKYETDVEKVSTSEAMMPAVDEEGNEFYYVIKISVPRGKRNGEGSYEAYDGYAAAAEYRDAVETRNAEKAASAAKKEAAAKEKQRKRDAKKVVKELNKKGLDAMIHEDEAADAAS